VDALEETTLLVMTKRDFQELLLAIRKWRCRSCGVAARLRNRSPLPRRTAPENQELAQAYLTLQGDRAAQSTLTVIALAART
jgi:hypothetical protein